MHDPLHELKYVIGVLTRASDFLSVLFAAIVAAHVLGLGHDWPDAIHRTTILASLLLVLIIFERTGLYEPWRGRSLVEQAGTLSLAWLTIVGILVLSAYVLQVHILFRRSWVLTWFGLSFLFLMATRFAVVLGLRYVRARGWNHKKVVIVGADEWAQAVATRLRAADWTGLDVEFFVDDNPGAPNAAVHGVPVRAQVAGLSDAISEYGINEVWFCSSFLMQADGQDMASRVLYELRHSTVDKRVVPNIAEMELLRRPFAEVLGFPVISLNSTPFYGVNRILKFIEDKVLSLLILIVLSPVLAGVAIAIKITSPGPILFRQPRHGWDGRPFMVYKFRSMVVHEEEKGRVTQASKDDPRVTQIGRFLRHSSLDELPQFLNVLKGDMSIVGPRPHPIPKNEYYMDRVDSYMQRHRVKPGITGWAQVNGWRGETDTIEKMQRRVEHDLYYIDNWSIWLDLKIIALTVFRGMRGENAY